MSKKFHSVHPTDTGPSDTGPTDTAPADDTTAPASTRLAHPLAAGMVVATLAAAASHVLPEEHASSAVALVLLGATYFLCLRRDHHLPPQHYGLSLGGLLDPVPLSAGRMLRDFARAFLVATLAALVLFPPFWWGFIHWYEPTSTFDASPALSGEGTSAGPLW